jgi:ribosome-associated protein
MRLDQALKWQGLVATGGEAKLRIQGGEVQVNGSVESRRGRKLQAGDVVELAGRRFTIEPTEPVDGTATP